MALDQHLAGLCQQCKTGLTTEGARQLQCPDHGGRDDNRLVRFRARWQACFHQRDQIRNSALRFLTDGIVLASHFRRKRGNNGTVSSQLNGSDS